MPKEDNKTKPKEQFAVTFHGKSGEYMSGVPRRNLTQEMWDLLPRSVQKRALASKIYKIVAKSNKEGK